MAQNYFSIGGNMVYFYEEFWKKSFFLKLKIFQL